MNRQKEKRYGQSKLARMANKKVDPKTLPKIYYKTEMIKKNNQIVWRAVERPSGIVIRESFFEEDVKEVVKFQNKNKTFDIFGFPNFFDCRTPEEIEQAKRRK